MNVRLDTWYDSSVGKSRFRCKCRRCGDKFHVCDTPLAAYRAAERKGYDLETGLCKVCHLMESMKVLTTKRNGEAA